MNKRKYSLFLCTSDGEYYGYTRVGKCHGAISIKGSPKVFSKNTVTVFSKYSDAISKLERIRNSYNIKGSLFLLRVNKQHPKIVTEYNDNLGVMCEEHPHTLRCVFCRRDLSLSLIHFRIRE